MMVRPAGKCANCDRPLISTDNGVIVHAETLHHHCLSDKVATVTTNEDVAYHRRFQQKKKGGE